MYLKNYSLQHFADAGCAVIPLIWDQSAYLPSSSEKLDGILAIGIFSDAQTNSLASLSSSVIFLDSAPDELRFDSVVLNFQLGVEQAVDYLIAHGHREIGFLGALPQTGSEKAPRSGSPPGIFYPVHEGTGTIPQRIYAGRLSNDFRRFKKISDPTPGSGGPHAHSDPCGQ